MNPVKILVLNSKKFPTQHFKDLGLDIEVIYRDLDVTPPLELQYVGANGVKFYSPNVEEYIRGIIEPNQFNFVLWCYPDTKYPENTTTGGKSYAYPHVYIGTHYATIRIDGNEENYMKHELKHLFCYHLNKLGYPTTDVMDTLFINGKWENYYKEWTPEDPDSNHMRTWASIAPYKAHLSDFAPVMKRGMNKNWVALLQQRMGYPMYPFLVSDGNFGAYTEKCVKDFQKKKGLVADGIVGPKTLSALETKKKLKLKLSLIEAIIQVESKGNLNAVGDKTLQYPAYGCMQIRQPVCFDINKRFGTNYKSIDCLGNKDLSIEIWNKYQNIYNPNGSNEEKSRTWNGGPGWRIRPHLTEGYWNKVKSLL